VFDGWDGTIVGALSPQALFREVKRGCVAAAHAAARDERPSIPSANDWVDTNRASVSNCARTSREEVLVYIHQQSRKSLQRLANVSLLSGMIVRMHCRLLGSGRLLSERQQGRLRSW